MALPLPDAPRPAPHTLRLVLGDQLDEQHPWFTASAPDPGVLYVMFECRSETDYAHSHIQRLAAFLLAMRLFAQRLQALGHRVYYVRLTDAHNRQSLPDNLTATLEAFGAQAVAYQQPDEYRLDGLLAQWAQQCPVPVQVVPTAHFLTTRTTVGSLFAGRKRWLMETFYRQMRRQTGLLMDAHGQPEGGRWNFDPDNRQPPPRQGLAVPALPRFDNDYSAVLADLHTAQVPHFGHARHLPHALTRPQALQLLHHFVNQLLPHFGTYQDAMLAGQPWLYHSLLSFALNVKLLHPLEVCQAAIDQWRRQPERIALHQVEGFVRQIIGWREYMRGLYWAHMPALDTMNHLQHTRPLPSWYWTGQVRMNCLRQVVGQSLDYAYAHHIQRLMITGNFALLAGCHPSQVDAWYLGVYVDALEWVQKPNTRGMSQFADGGITATKPYISAGAYIQRMSNYCQGCPYNPKLRTGPQACPFNSLYWAFLHRHRHKLAPTGRMAIAYKNLDALPPQQLDDLLAHAAIVLHNIENL